jgi:hypothetical protein
MLWRINVQVLLINGTSSEVIEVFERFPQLATPSHQTALPKGLLDDSAPRYWTQENIRKLVGYIGGDQRKIMRFLMEQGGKATPKSIRTHMHYGNNGQKLAARLSGLTRNAKRATGFDKATLVDWRRRNDDDQEGEYFIVPDAYRTITEMGIKF